MKFHYLVFFLSIAPLKGMSPEPAKYYAHAYAAPSQMKEELDAAVAHSQFPHSESPSLRRTPTGSCSPDNIRSIKVGQYWVKRDITRLQGMELIREAAQAKGCGSVIVPDQHIYMRPDGVSFIVSEGIIEKKPQRFTQPLIKELYKVAKATGYWDLNTNNIKVTSEGKVAFLDTQMLSFDEAIPSDKETKLTYLRHLYDLPLDQEADAYVLDKFTTTEAI